MSRTHVAILLLVCLGLMSLYSPGQTESPASSVDAGPQWIVAPIPQPQTQLESFAARKNIVIVKGHSKVAEVSGDDGAIVRITAVEFANANTPQDRKAGLAVQINEGGRFNRSAVSYVDADEIDNLLDAIARLTQLQSTATKLTDYDAGYRTRGDLEVTNLAHNGTRSGGVRSMQILVPSGQIVTATAFLRLPRLQELHQQIATAKQTLEKLGSAGQ